MKALALLFAILAVALAACSSDQDTVTTQTQVAARDIEHSINPQVTQIAIVDDYALTTWTADNGAGQAILKKNTFTWAVLGINDAKIDAAGLGGFGVPADVAYKLEQQVGGVTGSQ